MSNAAVEGLRANHADLQAILAQISDEDWSRDSACAGWRVQDVLAHVTSNFKEMIEPSPSPTEAPPAMTAEQAMEALVAPRKDWTPAQLLAEYAQYRDAAFATLAGMQEEPTASTVVPLADLGMYPLHMLADAYCFDHYCHLRHDLLAPSGPLQLDVPAADDTRVRPGIDWMLAGLPQMCRDTLTVLDKPITLALTGAGGGTWTIHPAGDDGLVSIVENDADGVAVVTSSAHDFVSWGTVRSSWRDACEVNGDAEYAAVVLDAINIV